MSTSLRSALAPKRKRSGVSQCPPSVSPSRGRDSGAPDFAGPDPAGGILHSDPIFRSRSSGRGSPRASRSVTGGVAAGTTFPVDVLMKSPPAAIAISLAWRTDVRRSQSSPVLEDHLQVRRAARDLSPRRSRRTPWRNHRRASRRDRSPYRSRLPRAQPPAARPRASRRAATARSETRSRRWPPSRSTSRAPASQPERGSGRRRSPRTDRCSGRDRAA